MKTYGWDENFFSMNPEFSRILVKEASFSESTFLPVRIEKSPIITATKFEILSVSWAGTGKRRVEMLTP